MLDRGGINSLIRLIHTIVNEKLLHYSRGSGGTGTPPVPPETMKNHLLDPDAGPHTGTLPEDEVVFEGGGHPHSGGAGGKKVAAADVVNVPAGGIAATDVQGALDELDGEKTGVPVAEGDVTFDDGAGHDHQGAGNKGKKISHPDVLGVTADQHHPESHAPDHKDGGAQALDLKELVDSEGRLLTGTQKTDLTDGGATILHAHAGTVTAAVKITLTNQTGSERSINDVVVTDPDHDESFIGTSGSPGYQGKVLVVAETISTSGSGPCWERGGPFNINVVGAVDRNDGLRTSATIYKAEAAPSVVSDGVFAIALSTSGSGGGTIRAVFLDVVTAGGDGDGDGGGAPTDAKYVVTEAHADLSEEVVHEALIGHNPDDYPAAPAAQDDEFDDAALDVKWTRTGPAGGASAWDVHTTWKSWVHAFFDGDTSINLSQGYAPGGDFTITMKGTFAPQGNYQELSLYVYDNDESDGMWARVSREAGSVMVLHLTSRDTGSWNYWRVVALDFPRVNTWYVKLRRRTNTWEGWFSTDGFSYFRIGTWDKTFTVHHFEINITQGGQTIPVEVGFDWVRITA